MIGTTGVRDLEVTCIVGIYPHERVQEQSVFLDIEIDYDFGPAHASDAIEDVVDYDMAVPSVTTLIPDRQFSGWSWRATDFDGDHAGHSDRHFHL